MQKSSQKLSVMTVVVFYVKLAIRTTWSVYMIGHSTKLCIEKVGYLLVQLDNLLNLYILKTQSVS